MKSILKLSFSFLFAVIVVFSACKKYADGPTISLKTKTARLTRAWVDESCTSGCVAIEFKKDGSINLGGNAMSGASWKFSSDKKNIEFTSTILGVSSTSSSEILKLTSKEFWVKGDNGGADTHYKAQ